ncbi:phosphotransferase [Cytobacillus sp. Sa5YUA1]|uniref:Phosphotransferase n=1 Tax=Cytobacillus stercorigallinarum TaxID=2762240 RepID=A0ABR8QRX8_9BACI|nr:phosphotransferase [Cytobacillus stercorigallinarum]MBD7938274.1 phosphotransferase [Cytobacillus stercorigallinarum]
MSAVWDSDVEVTIDEAQQIISEQFPILEPVITKESGEGWDNKVFVVNESVIFRFPRRKMAVPLLARENRWLPQLKQHLHSDIQISAPIYIGQPSSKFPYPFTGYPLIKGVSTNEREIRVEDRGPIVEDIALFLKALHQVPSRHFHGIIGDEIGRLDVHAKKTAVIQRLEWMEENEVIDSRIPFLAMIQIAANTSVTARNTLVHGDFYFRNFLIRDDLRLAGVIDFGDMHRGHRAVDLAVAYTFFPSYMRERFFSLYGAIDKETESLAMFRGLHVMCYLFFYGMDKQDEGIIREAKVGLANLISNH